MCHEHQDGEVVIPLLSEELDVSKQVVTTGRVSVTRITREHSEPIAAALAQESAEISRRRVGRYVETVPAVRQEGDTFVVPIVEERLVIERRLFLKEEVCVRRVRVNRMHEQSVDLRHHEVIVGATPEQTPPAGQSADGGPLYEAGVINMSYQTVVAAFDSAIHAQAAADALKTSGYHVRDISVLNKGSTAGVWTGRTPGVWQRMFGRNVLEHEAGVYDDVLGRGGAVVSVRVPDSEVAHATGILDLHHPIDVHDRAFDERCCF